MEVVRGVSVAALLAAAGCGAWGDRLACGDQGCEFTEDEWARVKALANVTATPVPPDLSNRYLPLADWTTGDLLPDAASSPIVNLGWHLYYETRLSGSRSDKDSTGAYAPTPRKITCGQVGLACASCHDPEHEGSDDTSVPRHVSVGAGWYDVNSQQTLNAARFSSLYWNGRTDAVWAQAAQVMESAVSMNGYRTKTFWVVVTRYRAAYDAVGFTAPTAAEIDALAARLAATAPSLVTGTSKEFKAQYTDVLTEDEKKVVLQVHVNAAKAIAAYELLLSSDNSPFDKFVQQGPSSTALTPSAVRGLKLFVGRASCIDCHNTPMFSDGKFHNIGIAQTGDHVPTVEACAPAGNLDCDCSSGVTSKSCLPSGAFGGRQKLLMPAADQFFHRGGDYDDSVGKTPLDPTPPDDRLLGAWRTPSLRDVAKTAPYMHDGSLATLTDVLWHYSEADGAPALGKSELAPLQLDAQDREDLVAFLQSLTGEPGWSQQLGGPAWAGLMHKPPDQAEP
ncbi:MAG TPA: cytochrome c peroxidase, partial [Polyangia bacterium]